MKSIPPSDAEWLEVDGHGGFASGTVGGPRTRRYHGLLVPALNPPTGRVVLVAGMDSWVESPGAAGGTRLLPQRYWPDVLAPEHPCRLVDYHADPWPTWTLETPGGEWLEHEVFIHQSTCRTILRWRVVSNPSRDLPAGEAIRLNVRLLLAARDYHSLQHENGFLDFNPAPGAGPGIRWTPFAGMPSITAWISEGEYRHDPVWYRRFQYNEEQGRGLDFLEDLASPGVLTSTLNCDGWTCLVLGYDGDVGPTDAARFAEEAAREERARRARWSTPLLRAADAYLVSGNRGCTVIAGYPWFADWGRDTFISMRGLCLATGRLNEARDILLHWASQVSAGMLPNHFSEGSAVPEYNTVDAALWFVVVAAEWIEHSRRQGGVETEHENILWTAIDAILAGYAAGTRYGIRLDRADGLLAAGAPGWQLTWMDARSEGREVTPRIGKPVEIQALWINCLRLAEDRFPRWQDVRMQAQHSFGDKFWNEAAGGLFDVVDGDHRLGENDASVRPNQIFAVGGLPYPLLDGSRAYRLVKGVENVLLTPVGLRTLAPGTPGYAGRYEGGPAARDAVYHQGTVWPWLLGPFVEAWVRVRGSTASAKQEARTRFLEPLLAHGAQPGTGHLPEIADGDWPHPARGCPFQAWSVGEALRLDRVVLGNLDGENLL